MDRERIRYEDAAEKVTLLDENGMTVGTAWISKHRRFISFSEFDARIFNCNDRPCSTCGARMLDRGWCEPCRQKRIADKWDEMQLDAIDWDGKTPLNVYDTDKYLWNADDVSDYIEEHGEDARLVLCEPDNGRHFEMSEYLCDSLPEDGDIDDQEINDIVNKWIAGHAPYSWWPSDIPVRVKMPLFAETGSLELKKEE